MPSHFDVAIVGAGPAGSATAKRLAQSGCRVALIERSNFSGYRIGESLAPSVQPLLQQLGVWSSFTSLSPLPSYGTRSFWGSDRPQEHSHLVNAYGCGWHVDRLAFDRMLAEAAAAAGVQLWRGITGFHCRRNRDSDWRLIFGQGRSGELNSLSARVLIDATGRSASVARQLGANRVALDRLVGVAVLFRKIEISDQGYVMVETVPEGWWYSAPVPPLGIIAMLMTDSDVCGHIKASQPPQWSQLLAKAPATSARVADRDVMWGPRVCSALSQRLRRYRTDDRWLAVGDAALAVDPISGSGVVRALRNAEAAARTAMTLLAGESEETIEAYESACDQDFSAYSRERGQYYALEVRWTESAFWQRRAGTFD